MNAALLELYCLPNIQWFANYLKYDIIWVEQHENFIKSTSRNRYGIAAANGKQVLSIPLAGGRDHHQKYCETKISTSSNWQHSHWQSIRSAYGSAPFFEFYADRLQPFYQKKYELLFEFNLDLLQAVLNILKEKKKFLLTASYEDNPGNKTDLRAKRNEETVIKWPRYYQVFEERHGFIPNLSVVDLIFNLGPLARNYLLELQL